MFDRTSTYPAKPEHLDCRCAVSLPNHCVAPLYLSAKSSAKPDTYDPTAKKNRFELNVSVYEGEWLVHRNRRRLLYHKPSDLFGMQSSTAVIKQCKRFESSLFL